jgi:hypothetical protein
MAKALLGHVGGPDHRLVDEVRRLKQRVSDLEAEVLRLRSANDALAVALDDDRLTLDDPRAVEPVLA